MKIKISEISGITLIELLVALGIMTLLFAIVHPHSVWHKEQIEINNTTHEIFESIKLARHLSVYEESSYFVRIRNNQLIVQKNSWGSQPVQELSIPEHIVIRFFNGNSVTFSRNGTTSYNHILIGNEKADLYKITLSIGSSRVDLERID